MVADNFVQNDTDYVAGANKVGYHLRNVRPGRDFTPDLVGDIALAQEGDRCPQCGAALYVRRGIEIGHVFKLGTYYSERTGATYLNAAGEERFIWMGSYGIGLGRLLACVIEAYHDAQGIVWPPEVAPYQVHIVSLGRKGSPAATQAEELYHTLSRAGYAVLWDDRDERAGVKFNDADLIGVPVRITTSRRNLEEGCIELKARWRGESQYVSPDAVQAQIDRILPSFSASAIE